MNILIMNCHTANRGDEAAVRALIDELIELYPNVQITLGMRGSTRYPNLPQNVESINQVIVSSSSDYKYCITKLTKGRVAIGKTYYNFISKLKKADLVLHAPGGPSIGDTYYDAEASYLYIYDLLIAMHKTYMFYAPSMGPFEKTERNSWRRNVLLNARAIALRDPISAEYVKKLVPERRIYQTLDSAFQHDIDVVQNREKFVEFSKLQQFMNTHRKCVGVTITDLSWHPVHSKNKSVSENIKTSFEIFMKKLVDDGYGIIFIPQLYGTGNDYDLMCSYCFNQKDFFVIPANDERYDTYFQQYLIGQLYAVIGMRYHSNIFSAKMGTPFISISYEQKMQGFMEKLGLSKYCIKLSDLTPENLIEKFDCLEKNHANYKEFLVEKHDVMKKESYRTTEIVKKVIDSLRG